MNAIQDLAVRDQVASPAASPLARRALYIDVAERLRAAILSHQLAPGSWIDEQALAADYGISRAKR